jgi:N-acetylglucosaminyldiphosphoundecaprenol N-acetyl-beta-D-mannosaminyltransferase
MADVPLSTSRAARPITQISDAAGTIVTRHSTFRVSELTGAQVLEEMHVRRGELNAGRSHLIVTPNMHHLAMLQTSETLASAYTDASMLLADGWPVVRLANALGADVTERVTGSDIVGWLADSNGSGRSVFIIGGSSTSSLASATKHFLRNGWAVGSNLATAEWLADLTHLDDLSAQLDDERPDIVLVGLGTPKQELVAQYLRRGTSTAIFVCVGAGIDFLSGEKNRAPMWMQDAGLEWLHRIVSEPGRLLKRYLGDIAPFIAVMRQSRPRSRR